MAHSLWLFVLAAIIANAQEITGSIAGIVTDGNGGILANAEVVSTHTETGVARRVRTNTEGQLHARRDLHRLQAREAVQHHPSFTTVAAGVDTTQNSFGAVTGTRDARVLQFALKLYF